VLSRAQADRSVTAFGTKVFFRGATIGCYTCHQGPGDDSQNTAPAPVAANVSASTRNDQPVSVVLPVTGAGAVARIISQPSSGTVGLSNGVATYFPGPGFVGTEQFTYAAYDGSKNSNLATGVVEVVRGAATLGVTARAPETYPEGWPVPFTVVAALGNDPGPVECEWDFGDGSPVETALIVRHAYGAPGVYHWRVQCRGARQAAAAQGSVQVSPAVRLAISTVEGGVALEWVDPGVDLLLESVPRLEFPAVSWAWVSDGAMSDAGLRRVVMPAGGNALFRLRRPE
jgi:hypothetical protein